MNLAVKSDSTAYDNDNPSNPIDTYGRYIQSDLIFGIDPGRWQMTFITGMQYNIQWQNNLNINYLKIAMWKAWEEYD